MSDTASGSRMPWLTMLAVAVIGGVLMYWAIGAEKPQLVWLVSLLVVAIVMMLFGNGVVGVWCGIFIDRRNVISLSRVQMVLWTILVVSAVLAAGLWNLHMQLDALSFSVPQELWALMGISSGSAVMSTLILSNKGASQEGSQDQFDRQKALAQPVDASKVPTGTPEGPDIIKNGVLVSNRHPTMANWSDMVTGDETGNFAHIDLSKVQMLIFTLIAVAAYGLSLWTLFQAMAREGGFTQFPAFDQTILTLIGISHAGYLSYKAAPNSDPADATK